MAGFIEPPITYQLRADQQDKQIGSTFEAGELVEQLDEHRRRGTDEDDTDHATGDDDPQLGVRLARFRRRFIRNQCHRCQNRVDSKSNIRQFHRQHRRPEFGFLGNPLLPARAG